MSALDLSDDQLISIALVLTLLVLSRLKDLLDFSGIVAATATGLTVSLLGHWTWLVALFVFLVIGSLATKWRKTLLFTDSQRFWLYI